MRVRIGMLFAASLWLLLTVSSAFAGTIVVDDLGDSGTNCTLRDAIDHANSGGVTANGCTGGTSGANTISIPSGTYTVGSRLPTITTTMTIQPVSGTVIIQADASPNVASYQVFSLSASANLTLSGVTVRNGSNLTLATSVPIDGGCISGNTGTLHFINAIVEGCRGRFGGAVLSSGTVTVTGSTFRNNQANRSGGAIMMMDGSLTITNSTIRDNQNVNPFNNGSGGGVYVTLGSGTLSVTGSTFANNSVGGGGIGGGLYFGGSSASVSSSVFTGNSATGSTASSRGGAILHIGTGTFAISNSRIQSNAADSTGGAIYSGGSVANGMTITATCITGNSDPAVFDNAAVGVITASGGGNPAQSNWWGASTGPHIAAAGGGSALSWGDSINGNGATVSGNILVDVALTSATPPTGAWLTSPPTVARSTCQTCIESSSVGGAHECSINP